MLDPVIAFVAQYFYLVVLAGAIIFLAVQFRLGKSPLSLREFLLAALLIGVVAYLLSKVGNLFVNSPRPFLLTGVPPLIPSSTDNGFPSDHTLLLAFMSALVFLVNKRAGILFLVLAVVIGLARVYAGVHHLLDVIGSLVIVALALLLYLLVIALWRRASARGLFRNTR
jgi:undecaprenyl-diphosphatase